MHRFDNSIPCFLQKTDGSISGSGGKKLLSGGGNWSTLKYWQYFGSIYCEYSQYFRVQYSGYSECCKFIGYFLPWVPPAIEVLSQCSQHLGRQYCTTLQCSEYKMYTRYSRVYMEYEICCEHLWIVPTRIIHPSCEIARTPMILPRHWVWLIRSTFSHVDEANY